MSQTQKKTPPVVPYKLSALFNDRWAGNRVTLTSVQGVQYRGVIQDIQPAPGQDYRVKLHINPQIGVKDVLVRAS